VKQTNKLGKFKEQSDFKCPDGANRKGDKSTTLQQNSHPTVKPLKLMEYLCTLTKTPTGGIVLDPFAGSGTTGLACQNTDRDFIGIEKEPEYVKIAEARLKFNGKQEKLI
jgi:site-specific DNA-methyltransferase (adenine-specific)